MSGCLFPKLPAGGASHLRAPRRASLSGLLVSLVLALPALADSGTDYIWPLAYKGCLTSSFAEYRRSHFHAGIDLSTNGKTGFKVRAVADGEVYRVRASPYGYGKVVYLLMADGTIAVFAHLSDYSPGIREVVEKEQRKRGRYEIDLRLPPGTLPVVSGEIIGFSGQTGVGAPHLHFELRHGEDKPVNPILNGFPVHDDVPPEIRSAVLTPLEGTARVNGSLRPASINFTWSESDRCFRVEGPVSIEGPVGLMIQTDDRQTSCDRILGVYRLDLRVNDEIIYLARFDHFSYDVADLVGIEFDRESIERGGSRYHRLFTTASNLLPFTITDRRNAGILNADGGGSPGEAVLAPGTHQIELIVADASGNESRAVIDVVAGQLPSVRRVQIADDREVSVFVDLPPGRIGAIDVSRSLNGARRWDTRPARYSDATGGWFAGGFAATQAAKKPLIFRVDLSTSRGIEMLPVYLFRNYEGIPTPEPMMNLSIEYHADAALVVLELDRAFPYDVEGRVVLGDRSVLRPDIQRVSPRQFEGVVQLGELGGEKAWVEVTVRGRDGA